MSHSGLQEDSDSAVAALGCVFYVVLSAMFNFVTLVLCCVLCGCKLLTNSDVAPVTRNQHQHCQTDFMNNTQVVVIHPNDEIELIAS